MTDAVLVFPTCLGDLVGPDTVADGITVLEACGIAATAVTGATCCGQPAFNAGHQRAALKVARQTLRALGDGSEPIVVPSGSCAAMMRLHWRELFHGDRDADRARAASSRVREWSSVVAERVDALAAAGPRWPGRVGYHDSCHMLRELRLREEPRALLRAVEGVEFVELPSADRCCGFGGTFSVRYPDVSVAMADTKLDDAAAAGVEALVSADPGCLLQLGGRLSRRGSTIRPLPLQTLLAEALDGR